MNKSIEVLFMSLLVVGAAWADEEEDLALKLANPFHIHPLLLL